MPVGAKLPTAQGSRHGSKNIASCPNSLMITELGVMKEETWGEFAESGLQLFKGGASVPFAERPDLRWPEIR